MHEQLIIDITNPVLSNHKAYGQELLPGLAYIDILYQIFREKGYDYKELELKNLSIYAPLIANNNYSILLNIQCLENKNGEWNITVEGREQRERNVSSEIKRYITAEMHKVEPVQFNESLDIDTVKNSAVKKVNLNEIYKQWRQLELVHTGFMIAEGNVFETDDATVMELSIGEEALSTADDIMFHPTLIDGTGIGSGGLFIPLIKNDNKLFLPLFYESFRASELFQRKCYARIKTSSVRRKNELLYMTMEFFNDTGEKIGELRNYINKLVRGAELINPNLKDNSQKTKFSAAQTSKNVNIESEKPGADKKVEYFLKKLLSNRIGVSEDQIDPQVGYYEMGLDSPGLLEVVSSIEEKINTKLSPTLLFEYTTISELSDYLNEKFSAAFGRINQNNKLPSDKGMLKKEIETTERVHDAPQVLKINKNEDIAIIGMSGRYPGAKNLNEFWINLIDGKDCISEIPESRWNWRQLEGFKSASGKNMSRWGGFIEDPDCFDPHFFRISPREAEIMDPQERLFLEVCWEAIEDAGYTPKNLVQPRGSNKRRHVGVFVGAMHKDYLMIGTEALYRGEVFPLSQNYAPIANRVSYFCNFHGPSMAIDTVCSSSLTAVHLAIENILAGECEVALAGGVNLSLHPNKYLTYGLMDMHSSDGYSHAFGKGADGYVSGEGIGAVLLKPVSRAVQDRDNIYAVIKGSSINHVGTVSGMTVPSPVGQADMIVDCFEKTGINPRTISYIEAHGTGTSLGDPIEMQGLIKAFTQFTEEKQFCSIGSVKSNIGHAEAAAGISGLHKLALQLNRKTFVSSLHAEELNPLIDFKNSPFYVQRKTEEWKQPIIWENNRETVYPRRGGISSFGATGSNAHAILEEYIPEINLGNHEKEINSGIKSVIIPLSAKNQERLLVYAERLMEYLRINSGNTNLIDLSYTLQTGREAFEERVAFLAGDISELLININAFLEKKESSRYFHGNTKQNKDVVSSFAAEKDFQEITEKWISEMNIDKLAELWTKGVSIEWDKFYKNLKPSRISLPTYPFAQEKYWIPETASKNIHKKRMKTEMTEKYENTIKQTINNNKGDVYGLLAYEEIIEEMELEDKSSTEFTWKKIICFISESRNQEIIGKTLKEKNAVIEIIYVSPGKSYKKNSKNNYIISNSDPKDYETALSSIENDYHEVDAVIYMWGIENEFYVRNYSPFVLLLQGVNKSKLKPERIIMAGQYKSELDICYLESWIGFGRSLRMLMPKTSVTVMYGEAVSMKSWTERLWDESKSAKPQSAVYKNAKRYVHKIQPTYMGKEKDILKEKGTYLITGGLGGLGFIFAKYLAEMKQANLILIGRSDLDETRKIKLKVLEESGGRAIYIQADVSDIKSMKNGLKKARRQFGGINGILHAAGIESTNNIFIKDINAFNKILEPKIKGTLVLSELLKHENPDFICYFSSSSAIIGDFGSCDYAVGNRFQVAYGNYMNSRDDKRRTVVINWPLWKEGGMGVGNDENTKMYLKSSGQRQLETDEGISIFRNMLSQEKKQCLIIAGIPDRVNRFLGIVDDKEKVTQEMSLSFARKNKEAAGVNLSDNVQRDLKNIISTLLKTSVDRLDNSDNLADFGFDSISLMELAAALTEYFGIETAPSLFFGYSTINKLAVYFLEEHRIKIEEFYNKRIKDDNIGKIPGEYEQYSQEPASIKQENSKGIIPNDLSEPIAIIGMSGKFPGARNVAELWSNLSNGINTISTPSDSRWSGKGRFLLGGFIPDMDCFDPLFFGITPKEAEQMDPRQRLFLEEAWHAVEDAGHMNDRFKGSSCGVFVGVEEGEYEILAGEDSLISSNQNATLSARIAYALDLKGPNFALTAACSSGLVALHQACQSLRMGDCDTALVGGISVSITPRVYNYMDKLNMLSPDGVCRVFDNRANGMVPGEAVAVVFLKPLSKAISDRDYIYGCVKGSGVNYDGKTNGIAAPDAISQAELVNKIYNRYRIDPDKIQYIHAHSLGSKLGDPIEIEGLKTAFKNFTSRKQYCAIGSVKPLIGHTFAASGIVSLIVILLSMKNQTMLGISNHESANEYIHFSETPFYVSRENRIWKRLNNEPRMGAIGSTGISGTNAHAVIEEYVPLDSANKNTTDMPVLPQLVLISAKDKQRLQSAAGQIIEYAESKKDISLSDFAYSLQTGRLAMESRLALIANSMKDVIEGLTAYLESNHDSEKIDCSVPTFFGETEELRNVLKEEFDAEKVLKESNLTEIASYWVKGEDFNWELLYSGKAANKIPLPGYPFAKEHYWAGGDYFKREGSPSLNYIHQLLHENTSTLDEQRFSSRFTGNEFFLSDHIVSGKRTLPGVAYLEMVRAAASYAGGYDQENNYNICIKNIAWIIPFTAEENEAKINVGLFPKDGEIGFEVYSESNDENKDTIIHSQGRVFFSPKDKNPSHDLEKLKSECSQYKYSSEQCYEAFVRMGIQYGPAHRGVDYILKGETGVLARLSLPVSVENSLDQYVLHPSLLDAALQAGIALLTEDEDFSSESALKPVLPFALDEVEVFDKCRTEMWVFLRYSSRNSSKKKVKKLDIDLFDESGKVCVRMEGYSTRVLDKDKLENQTVFSVPLNEEVTVEVQKDEKRISSLSNDIFHEKTVKYLIQVLSSVFKIPADKIKASASLEKYGIDSIMVIQLTNELEKIFGSLPKTLFFEYQSINELSEYFKKTHKETLMDLIDIKDYVNPLFSEYRGISDTAMRDDDCKKRQGSSRFRNNQINKNKDKVKKNIDIAIVGISGRFPGARNANEFWENLKMGKDSIVEIPKDRWDYRKFYDKDRNKVGKTYSKWGGFIDDVDKFDPLFFNISPAEAEKMDPQERLFLECSYEALEDAGYTSHTLGKKVGVFAGAMYNEYMLYGDQKEYILSNIPASIANRVSYFFDFQGPSITLDTMCSSSLSTIHLACMSIKSGECDAAVAGGVNVSIHPNKYLSLGESNFVSSKGKCESFGSGGDGYVPGEAVGVILLKPLNEAEKSRDHIYGIIKGSAVNHGGKTNGFTVPNPNAQGRVIGESFANAGINPRTISYIEAHGTGTELGDPIEIAGLNKAFEEYTKEKQFCSIGSVKSNIGHCESAAGITGVIKVLMQIKHKQLAPSLHSKELNPNIDFINSPFVVQRELSDWKQFEIEGDKIPRRAGISSFGAGGSNAHVVIEEYIQNSSQVTPQKPALIVLSAKSEESLIERVNDLLESLREQRFCDYDLTDIAYTLQVGRECMDERLALVANSIMELEEKLRSFVEGAEGIEDLFRSRADNHNYVLDVFANDEDTERTIDTWIAKAKYSKLLALWVKGLNFDWNKLYDNAEPKKVSLPTYPFAKERCWVPEKSNNDGNTSFLYARKQAAASDEDHYGRLLDDFFNDEINIDDAARKIKEMDL